MPASKLDLSALTLPPLPPFKSKSIREQVFTHRSFYGRPTHLFEDSVEDPSPDNEKFEHLGDTVIALVVTTLLNEIYPGLRVGPATKARSMIVGNATLADISVAYKLHAQLRFHPAQKLTLLHSTSVQADVFESFVGGLYMDQGMDIVQPWLRELLRPLCCQAYTSVKKQHGIIGPSQTIGLTSPPSSSSGCVPGDTITTGHLALFNQHLQKSGLTVEWLYSSVTVDEMTGGSGPISNGNGNNSGANTNRSSSPIGSSDSASVLDRERVLNGLRTTPMWSVIVKVDGEVYGSGRGVTKKLAKNEAAKVGLGKLGISV